MIGETDMTEDTEPSEAGRDYEAAYAAHYTTSDLPKALELYHRITDAHPDTPEAEYSRAQIQNIVNAVVPKSDLIQAHLSLAQLHLESQEPPKASPPTMTLVSEKSNAVELPRPN